MARRGHGTTPCSRGTALARQQRQHACLVQHGHAQFFGLGQLAARVFTRHHIAGFLLTRPATLAPAASSMSLAASRPWRGQGAGQHHRGFAASTCGARSAVRPRARSRRRRAVAPPPRGLWAAGKRCACAARHGAYVGHLQQLLFGGGRFGVDAISASGVPKCLARVFGGGLAHMPDAQAKQKRGSVVCLDASSAASTFCRFLGHALSSPMSGDEAQAGTGQAACGSRWHPPAGLPACRPGLRCPWRGVRQSAGWPPCAAPRRTGRRCSGGWPRLFAHHGAAANGALARHVWKF